jgi:hypothetical protein
MIWILQVGITMILWYNQFYGSDAIEFEIPRASLMFIMLLTAYLFHIQAMADARNAYTKIQFLRRYPERFEKKLRFPALMLACQQFFIVIFAETLNLTFLCGQNTYLDLIMNYVALAGVLEIDNVFMST